MRPGSHGPANLAQTNNPERLVAEAGIGRHQIIAPGVILIDVGDIGLELADQGQHSGNRKLGHVLGTIFTNRANPNPKLFGRR